MGHSQHGPATCKHTEGDQLWGNLLEGTDALRDGVCYWTCVSVGHGRRSCGLQLHDMRQGMEGRRLTAVLLLLHVVEIG